MLTQQSEVFDLVSISGIETYPLSQEIVLATFVIDQIDKSVIRVSNSQQHPSTYLNDDVWIFDDVQGEIREVKAWTHIDRAMPGPYNFNVYLQKPFTGGPSAIQLKVTSAINVPDFYINGNGTINGETFSGLLSFNTPGATEDPVVINGTAIVSTAGFGATGTTTAATNNFTINSESVVATGTYLYQSGSDVMQAHRIREDDGTFTYYDAITGAVVPNPTLVAPPGIEILTKRVDSSNSPFAVGVGLQTVSAVLVIAPGTTATAADFGRIDGEIVPLGYSDSWGEVDGPEIVGNTTFEATGNAYWIIRCADYNTNTPIGFNFAQFDIATFS